MGLAEGGSGGSARYHARRDQGDGATIWTAASPMANPPGAAFRQPILCREDYDSASFAPERASSGQTMKYEFRWSSDVSDSKKASTEAAISEGQESGHSPISFCHEGTVVVRLELSPAFPNRFDGTMECSCGKTCGNLQGKCNGSSVTFVAVAS